MQTEMETSEKFKIFEEVSEGEVFRYLEDDPNEILMKIEEITDGKTEKQGYLTFNTVKLSNGEPTMIPPNGYCSVIDNVKLIHE